MPEVHNRLTLLEEDVGRSSCRSVLGRWLCSCGKETITRNYMVRGGRVLSCGCIATERSTAARLSHGHKRGTGPSRTYVSWRSMINRCTKEDNNRYYAYGARGIKVCDSWMKFENFLADMGERPEGTSLDRIDANGDYCPTNCRWADKFTQARNKPNYNRWYTFEGKTLTLPEWAEIVGISTQSLRSRLWYGWTVEQALTTPIGGRRG